MALAWVVSCALLPSMASAVSLPPSAAGKGIDFSNPLDGIADEVTPSTSTIDLERNAADPNPDNVREDRAIFEFDVSSVGAVVTSAQLEFEVFGPVAGVVDVYAYAGDGLLSLSDFTQTSSLANSPTLSMSSVSIDVASALQTLLDGGASTAGFLVALPAEDQLLSIHNVGFPPEPVLVVESLPASAVPSLGGPAYLALLALLGAVAMRRPPGRG